MKAGEKKKRYFTEELLRWHHELNNRQLPWKKETDPYKIWLSEIILQQTRAEQGLPYYHKFIKAYPDVKKLAAAEDEEVFLLWQGLGYYSRCRNLLKAARIISKEYNGIFPDDFDTILSLPGVGNYTASAIASFAFSLPYAVVDGNVYRVLSRYFGIATPIDSTKGKKEFAVLAQELLDKEQPGAFNQAIMDFGASVCKPAQPLCDQCYLADNCNALKYSQVDLLPVKEKRLIVKDRHFHYFLLEHGGELYIQLRTANDIWQHLHEPFLIEWGDDYKLSPSWQQLEKNISDGPLLIHTGKQRLTHQLIHSRFYHITLKSKPVFLSKRGKWVAKKMLKNFAFPKTIISFFNGNEYI